MLSLPDAVLWTAVIFSGVVAVAAVFDAADAPNSIRRGYRRLVRRDTH